MELLGEAVFLRNVWARLIIFQKASFKKQNFQKASRSKHHFSSRQEFWAVVSEWNEGIPLRTTFWDLNCSDFVTNVAEAFSVTRHIQYPQLCLHTVILYKPHLTSTSVDGNVCSVTAIDGHCTELWWKIRSLSAAAVTTEVNHCAHAHKHSHYRNSTKVTPWARFLTIPKTLIIDQNMLLRGDRGQQSHKTGTREQ